MNRELHRKWEARYRDAQPGAPASSLLEVMPLLPPGRALDVAAGDGANAVALARAGCEVIAVDFSPAAMGNLAAYAREQQLSISPLVADLEVGLPLTLGHFDVVLNIRYLDRALIPHLKDALRPGGMLLFDTFLIDQLAFGHPSNPLFMLEHYELRDLLSDMDLLRYREGLVVHSEEKKEWRAMTLARKNTSRASTGTERAKSRQRGEAEGAGESASYVPNLSGAADSSPRLADSATPQGVRIARGCARN